MTKQRKLFRLFIASVILISLHSCKKEKEEAIIDNPNPTSYGARVKTTICGRITDESGQPIANVHVSTDANITSSNSMGIFTIENANVAARRCIITFTRPGYLKATQALIPSKNNVTYVRVSMFSDAMTHTLDATTGGTLSLTGGASIQFPANAFVKSDGSTYTGIVNLTIHHLNTDNPDFRKLLPGKDLMGTDAQGKRKILYSYGMIGAELKDASGMPLQLAAGKQAICTNPIATSQLANAPATIPLWYFDNSTALWKEEGNSLRVGNNYVGNVAHFTWWNWDVSADTCYVTGRVIDCAGAPMPNAEVVYDNMYGVTSDNNGQYYDYVPAAWPATIYAEDGSSTLQSQSENVPSLSIGQVYNVPDLVMQCPSYITGRTVDCGNASMNATLLISGQQGYFGFYQTTGNFSIPVPMSNFTLTAYNGNLYKQQAFSGINMINTTLPTGDFQLCDSVGTQDNFYLNLSGAGIGNVSSSYHINQCEVDSILTGSFISIAQLDSTFTNVLSFGFNLPSYLPGTFNWNPNCNLTGVAFFNGQSYSMVTNSSAVGGQTIVINAAAIGGYTEVSFNGPVLLTSSANPSITIPATVNGSFRIYRSL